MSSGVTCVVVAVEVAWASAKFTGGACVSTYHAPGAPDGRDATEAMQRPML